MKSAYDGVRISWRLVEEAESGGQRVLYGMDAVDDVLLEVRKLLLTMAGRAGCHQAVLEVHRAHGCDHAE